MMDDKQKPSTSENAENTKSNNAKDEDSSLDDLSQFFVHKLNISAAGTAAHKKKVLDDLTLDGLIKQWKTKGFKRIITMVGAGISTSAGIPDFRSPGTGLYDNLQKYNLPYSMAIFDIEYFKMNPKPFFTLAKELYPGNFNPTPSHYFARLLHEKGILQRHYTQNIDTLERVAGMPEDKLVEAHGSFYTNHCIKCHKAYTKEWVKELVFNDEVPICTKCKGVVKPDIVFFGEDLPEKFYTLREIDFFHCDLLIVMGTSLEVYPFAALLAHAGPRTPRLIINRTRVIDCEEEDNVRDVVYMGDCDEACWAICEGMGWTQELKDLMQRENARLEKKYGERRRRLSSTSSVDEADTEKELNVAVEKKIPITKSTDNKEQENTEADKDDENTSSKKDVVN